MLTIRPATPTDIPALVQWNRAMAMETESRALDAAVLTKGVAAVLDEPRRGFYLLAERAGAPCGGLLVTCEWSDWRNGDFWWLQSVYVEVAARGQGVFRALYDAVESRARAAGAVGIRLYVERDNRRAQAVYAARGMHATAYHLYEHEFV